MINKMVHFLKLSFRKKNIKFPEKALSVLFSFLTVVLIVDIYWTSRQVPKMSYL